MHKSLDPYQEYENNAVNIAEPKKLILMLYSSAIDFLNKAVTFINDYKSYDKANENILKAQDIITELILALDMEKGGEIATNLFSLYTYMKKELLTANMTKSEKPIQAVLKYLSNLKEAWENVKSDTKQPIKETNFGGDTGDFVARG